MGLLVSLCPSAGRGFECFDGRANLATPEGYFYVYLPGGHVSTEYSHFSLNQFIHMSQRLNVISGLYVGLHVVHMYHAIDGFDCG